MTYKTHPKMSWAGFGPPTPSVNNISGTPNPDGFFTVHFGADPESENFLPIMEGWNYTVRLYRPRKELLDGR